MASGVISGGGEAQNSCLTNNHSRLWAPVAFRIETGLSWHRPLCLGTVLRSSDSMNTYTWRLLLFRSREKTFCHMASSLLYPMGLESRFLAITSQLPYPPRHRVCFRQNSINKSHKIMSHSERRNAARNLTVLAFWISQILDSDYFSTRLHDQSGAVRCPLPSGSGQGLSQSIVDMGHLMLSGAYRPLCLGYIFCREWVCGWLPSSGPMVCHSTRSLRSV